MRRSRQIAVLIALTLIGLVGLTATADEPKDKPQPKIVQAQKAQLIAAKPGRIFNRLLQQGQFVSLYRLRQEAPAGYQYQVRIVSVDQKKQIEDVVEASRKDLENYRSKTAAMERQMREATDRVKEAELREEFEQLRQSYKPRPIPTDIQSASFYRISDVGIDYVGFERNGVETFHRLSSIHTIIRGVELDQE